MTCEHPEAALREALLYTPAEAQICTACAALVFADGHTEPVQITAMTTSRR